MSLQTIFCGELLFALFTREIIASFDNLIEFIILIIILSYHFKQHVATNLIFSFMDCILMFLEVVQRTELRRALTTRNL